MSEIPVLIPNLQEWEGIKKRLMKKRLSKTDYREFSNISASLPKKSSRSRHSGLFRW